MEPSVVVSIIALVVSFLMGIVMFLARYTLDGLKEQADKHGEAINHIKEHYFKKEDFKEFKEELWGRFDKLERKVEERVNK